MDKPHEGSIFMSTKWTDPTRVNCFTKSTKWTDPTRVNCLTKSTKWTDPTRVKYLTKFTKWTDLTRDQYLCPQSGRTQRVLKKLKHNPNKCTDLRTGSIFNIFSE